MPFMDHQSDYNSNCMYIAHSSRLHVVILNPCEYYVYFGITSTCCLNSFFFWELLLEFFSYALSHMWRSFSFQALSLISTHNILLSMLCWYFFIVYVCFSSSPVMRWPSSIFLFHWTEVMWPLFSVPLGGRDLVPSSFCPFNWSDMILFRIYML